MTDTDSSTVWTFGYGSNMNVSYVEQRKGYHVFDHVVGVVHGYKMVFDIPGVPKLEPTFANAVKGRYDESIHGVAIQISEDDMEKLKKQERGYKTTKVTVNGYNGRTIKDCIMFCNHSYSTFGSGNPLPPEQQTPSARYMKILINGAIEANLDETYINRLREIKTYVVDEETLARRDTIPLPSSLPSISVDELFATKAASLEGEDAYVGILGYVVKMPRSSVIYEPHIGREITALILRYYNGILSHVTKNDDVGKPPYPKLLDLKREEVEYLYNCLDNFLDKGTVVGYLKEFILENDVTKV